MNNSLKIILIVVVLLGIAGTVFYFMRGMDDSGGKIIAQTPFEKIINSQVQKKIVGHEYAEAAAGFDAVLNDIDTEASIMNGDGTPQLQQSEAENCRKIAFFAFEAIFEKMQENYFKRSSWSDTELADIKSQAQRLLDMKIAEGKAYLNLQSAVKNVDDYHAAWAAVKSAAHCTTVSAVKAVGNNVDKYNHAPLTNNVSLNEAMQGAYSQAKTSLANNIKASCRRLAENYYNYPSYYDFYTAYENVIKRINNYVEAFGGEDMFGDSKSILREADQLAMDYYDY